MAGMYSEATAAHPYSPEANIAVGAHETASCSAGSGYRSVDNDAAVAKGAVATRRRSSTPS